VAARKEVEDADREIADAEADLENARAALTAAETVAARAAVRASFDGIIVKRSHNPGDLVEAAASDPVLRVVDPRRLEVAASIPIADAPRIRLGAAARLLDPIEGAGASTLKIASSPAAVQAGTATVPVRAAFTGPVNYPVGAPVQLEIEAETHRDVVLVPATAVVHEGPETAVFVAVTSGSEKTAQRRVVTTGLEDERRVEITKGVNAGDAVLTSGQNGLPDAAKITVASEKEEGDKPGGAPEAGQR
jgi:RND family efflux transporter MFP subunit